MFALIDTDLAAVDDFASAIAERRDRRVILRVLRGERMRTDDQAFDEIAAAMQFPGYFGRNWNAVIDCLRELRWMPGEGYILVVTSAAELFSDTDDGAVESFVRALNAAATSWREARTGVMSHPATPFSVVVQVDGNARAVRKRLESAGARFD